MHGDHDHHDPLANRVLVRVSGSASDTNAGASVCLVTSPRQGDTAHNPPVARASRGGTGFPGYPGDWWVRRSGPPAPRCRSDYARFPVAPSSSLTVKAGEVGANQRAHRRKRSVLAPHTPARRVIGGTLNVKEGGEPCRTK